jgi:uncharacterized protein
MQPALLLTVLGASLLGSLHCAAMCGGFVAWYAGCATAPAESGWLAHAAYHGGRLITYLTLGTLAGVLGRGLDLAGYASGLAGAAAIVTSMILLGWGMARVLEALGARLPRWRGASSLYAFALARLRPLQSWPKPLQAGLLGLSSTLLPCGWLYAFALVAAGTGTAQGGLSVMAAFWLGTLPMLLGLGVGLGSVLARARRHLPLLTAAAVLIVGFVGLLSRVNLPLQAVRLGAGTNLAVPAEPACHH